MNETLWEIVKKFSNVKELSAENLAFAEAHLDKDDYLVFKEQMEGKLKTDNNQWI